MATHSWNSSYQDLLQLTELPTLERRRLDLKLGQLFKIIHNFCYFPEGIINLREQTPLLTNNRFQFFILIICINLWHTQTKGL